MLRPAACALACALGLSALAAARELSELSELPPRQPVAGRHGFLALSRVRYAARTDLPHLLEVLYQFPGRARWRMSAEASEGGRLVEYRAGQQGFRILPAGAGSLAVEGADLYALVGRMELRRAAFFWPDGLAWEPAESAAPDEERRRAELRDELDPERLWGVIEARLPRAPAGARPRELVLLDPAGREGEKLVVHSWLEADGRSWPARLDFVSGGRTVWTEEVLEVTGNAYFLDLAFVPPDRRTPLSAGVPAGHELYRAVDLVPHVGRRHALEPRTTWSDALGEALGHARDAQQDLGSSVDPAATFELDAEGRPVACWVRLAARPTGDPPTGWEAVAERPGLLAPLNGPEEARQRLRLLLDHVPPRTQAATPYLRAYTRDGAATGESVAERRWELVLPLVRGS